MKAYKRIHEILHTYHPVKMLLQDLLGKGPLFLHSCKILWDLARSCEMLWDLVGFCRNFAQDSCKIPARSHKILQQCKKKDLFWRSCKSVLLSKTTTICWSWWLTHSRVKPQQGHAELRLMNNIQKYITQQDFFCWTAIRPPSIRHMSPIFSQ